MSGYTDESLNSDTRLSRASPAAALCSMASSWVSMGLAATLVTRTQQLMVTMMGEVSMVMCTEILMPLVTPHTSFIRSQTMSLLSPHPLHMRTLSSSGSLTAPGPRLPGRTKQLGFSDA